MYSLAPVRTFECRAVRHLVGAGVQRRDAHRGSGSVTSPMPRRMIGLADWPLPLLSSHVRNQRPLHQAQGLLSFADHAKRVNAYVAANPAKPIIRLGIGDVTEPLPPVCIAALHAGADEMADRATFKGYGPEQGYTFPARADRGA